MSNDRFFPLSVPNIDGNEWTYIKQCLDTEWVSTAGSFVERFEKDFAAFVGSRFAVACSSGSAALQVSLRCAGVQPGDEVLVPTLTFIATANAVSYLGAHPVFVDCDSFYNVSAASVQHFLDKHTDLRNGQTMNIGTGRRIAAICPVHVFGNAVDMDRLTPVLKGRNIALVEDAAESLGTRYAQGRYAGRHTGTIGSLGAFSFNGNKIITTGGGGMIVTDDEELATRSRHLTTTAKEDEVRYVHDEIGYNFRLTNVQAAMGVAQLECLPRYLDTKRRNYAAYQQHIAKIDGLHLGEVPDYAANNHWMYPLQIDAAVYGKDRERLMAELAENRMQTRPVWQLNHLQKPYRQFERTKTPVAERLLANTLCLPCSTNLTVEDVEHISSKL